MHLYSLYRCIAYKSALSLINPDLNFSVSSLSLGQQRDLAASAGGEWMIKRAGNIVWTGRRFWNWEPDHTELDLRCEGMLPFRLRKAPAVRRRSVNIGFLNVDDARIPIWRVDGCHGCTLAALVIINHFHSKWHCISGQMNGLTTLTFICVGLWRDNQSGPSNRHNVLPKQPHKSRENRREKD